MDHDHSPATHGRVKDPVCGMDVDPATARFSHEHAGQAFHFCSLRCLEKFKADPARFLQPSPAPAIAAAPKSAAATLAGRQYTCPMHPEIIRDVPGACPICGMALEPMMLGDDDEPNHELVDFSRRFWWTLPLSLVVLVLAMSGHQLTTPDPRTRVLIEMVLSTPVVLWAGWPFFVRCLQSLRTGNLNMWTLIGIGVGAAYGYSLAAALAPGLFPAAFHVDGQVGVYFETAAVIVSLTLLGQLLELRARSKTSAAIRALLQLAPKTARRLADDGTETDVPLDQVRVGDRLRVRPGEKVPVDGEVLEGRSNIVANALRLRRT